MADSEEPAQEVNAARGDSKSSQGLRGLVSTIPQVWLFSWLYAIPLVCVLGVFGILIYISQLPSGVRWGVFATTLVIGASAFLVGGFVGFLFGVPRTVQGSTPQTGVTQYQGNTNLEQVSDWLTKIIIGVSLVEIGRIIPGLGKFAESMKAPLGGQASSAAFGLGLVIANALFGFFYLYLWSRSLLARELGIYNTPQQLSGPEGAAEHADSASVNNQLNS